MQKDYRCHPGKQINTWLLQYWSILSNQYLITSQVFNSGTPKVRASGGEGGTERAAKQLMTKLKTTTVPRYRSNHSFIVWSKQDWPVLSSGCVGRREGRQSGTRRAQSWKSELSSVFHQVQPQLFCLGRNTSSSVPHFTSQRNGGKDSWLASEECE